MNIQNLIEQVSKNLQLGLLEEGRKENARAIASNLSDQAFQQLLDGDPTKDSPQNPYKYIEWMARQAKAGFSVTNIVELTKVYDQNLDIIPKDKPIQNFKTLKDLYSFISALDTEDSRDFAKDDESIQTDRTVERYIKTEEDKFHLVEESEEFIISRVINVYGSCELGKLYSAKWCLAGGMDDDVGPPTYNPNRGREHFDGYIKQNNILYFVMFKKINKTRADKAFAIIIEASQYDAATKTFIPKLVSIHDRVDDELSIKQYTQDPQRKITFDIINNDAKTIGSAGSAHDALSTVQTPEELRAGLDKYSKIMDKKYFNLFLQNLQQKIGKDLFRKANIKIEDTDSNSIVDYAINKGVFTTGNVNLKNVQNIGEAFRYISNVGVRMNERPFSVDKQVDYYLKFFNSYVSYAQNMTETQYLFILRKSAELNGENIIENTRFNTSIFSTKGKGLIYSLIFPLLTFEVVKNKLKKGPFEEVVDMPHIFINGINNSLLDVLKRELLKRPNRELRSLFSNLTSEMALPEELGGDPNNKKIEDAKSNNRFPVKAEDKIHSFLLVNENQYPLLHIRELCRQIIDTIAKVPYSAMSEEEVQNIVKYTSKDILSVNTDDSREETAQQFKLKVPKLIEVMKATFGARKRYIKFKYDKKQDITAYDYDKDRDITEDFPYLLTKHKYLITAGMGSTDILLSLDRKEINEYLTNIHNISFSNFYTDNSIEKILDYANHLSVKDVISGNPAVPTEVYKSFRSFQGSYDKTDSCIFNLNNPNVSESDRIKIALHNYYTDEGKLGLFSSDEAIRNGAKLKSTLTPEQIKIALDRTSDTVYDTIVEKLYINEEIHYRTILETLASFDIKQFKRVKDKIYLNETINAFALLLGRKINDYIKLVSLIQDSVQLTKKYGTNDKKQNLKPVIVQMFVEKLNNYKELMDIYNSLLTKFNIKNQRLSNTIQQRYTSIYSINDLFKEFDNLVQNIANNGGNMTENKQLTVRLRGVS